MIGTCLVAADTRKQRLRIRAVEAKRLVHDFLHRIDQPNNVIRLAVGQGAGVDVQRVGACFNLRNGKMANMGGVALQHSLIDQLASAVDFFPDNQHR